MSTRKLTLEDARAIRRETDAIPRCGKYGKPGQGRLRAAYERLAKKYGVHPDTIGRVHRRVSFNEGLPPAPPFNEWKKDADQS